MAQVRVTSIFSNDTIFIESPPIPVPIKEEIIPVIKEAKEEGMEEEIKIIKRRIFFGCDGGYGSIIEVDPDTLDIKNNANTWECPLILDDYARQWYGYNIRSGCVDHNEHTYWTTTQGIVYEFDDKLKPVTCWADWNAGLFDTNIYADSIAVDWKRDYVYLGGTYSAPGTQAALYRINASGDSLVTADLLIDNDIRSWYSMVVDNKADYLYCGADVLVGDSTGSKVIKVDLDNFGVVGSYTFSGTKNLIDQVVSSDGKYLILASNFQSPSNTYSKIVLFRIKDDNGNPDFTFVGEVVIGNRAESLVYYNGHVYVQDRLTTSAQHYIRKISIPDLKIVDSMPSGLNWVYTGLCFPEKGKAYWASHDEVWHGRGAQIEKTNLKSMEVKKIVSLSTSHPKIYCGCITEPKNESM